jgi:LPXTG-motif cell wall-anchored protein
MKTRMFKATVLSGVLMVGVLAGPAFAEYPPAEPPEKAEVIEKVVEKEEVVEQPTAVAAMPVTGTDAAGLTAAGIALLALGSVALRRRSSTGS